MATQKPLAEDWFGYWEIRIRDPTPFTRIRTPDWASYAATQMAKEWLVSGMDDFQVSPHLIPNQSLTGLTFIRGAEQGTSSRGNRNQGQVHARQGQLQDGQWVTQGVLIPQYLLVNGQLIEIPPDIAHEIACYIARRLDKSDDVAPSPYCSRSDLA